MQSLLTPLTYDHLCFQNPYNRPELFMMHSHNSYEIIFFEKGEATYVIEDRKYQLKKNDFIFIRPLRYHYIEINSNAEYTRYNITFNLSRKNTELIERIPESLEVLNCASEGVLANIFQRMDYYQNSLSDVEFSNLLAALLTEILYNVSLSGKEQINLPLETSKLLKNILTYINDNLFTIKTVKDICAPFFISEQYLFRQFQEQLKITPKKYLNAKRLLHAQKMLQLGKKPTAVYLECGFDSYVGFYKQYLKNFGYPPSQEKHLKIL